MIREMIVGFVLIVALLGLNVAWQHVHCGTPVCRSAPLQIIPCEPAEQVKAEIDYLERMAREMPSR